MERNYDLYTPHNKTFPDGLCEISRFIYNSIIFLAKNIEQLLILNNIYFVICPQRNCKYQTRPAITER